jgi:uncharacterized lipoprotein YmbA
MRACIGVVVLALAALAVGGCALTDKAQPISPRYFVPEPPMAAKHLPQGSGPMLRLYNVRAGSHIKSNMIFWKSDYELGFLDERRWVELPEVYLRRTLSHVLFEERGYKHVVAGGAPTLEVELTSFEEMRQGVPRVRVAVVAVLQDGGVALFEETIQIERPIPQVSAKDPGADKETILVENLGAALREVVDVIADRVDTALKKTPAKAAKPGEPDKPDKPSS